MDAMVSQSTRAKRSDITRQTYTLAELAGLLGRSYTSIHEAAQRGELPVEPIMIGRQRLFPKAVVDRLLGIADDGADAA